MLLNASVCFLLPVVGFFFFFFLFLRFFCFCLLSSACAGCDLHVMLSSTFASLLSSSCAFFLPLYAFCVLECFLCPLYACSPLYCHYSLALLFSQVAILESHAAHVGMANTAVPKHLSIIPFSSCSIPCLVLYCISRLQLTAHATALGLPLFVRLCQVCMDAREGQQVVSIEVCIISAEPKADSVCV